MPHIAPLSPEHKREYPAPATDIADLPVGFDAATFPILAEDWFGVSPAAVCVEAVTQAV